MWRSWRGECVLLVVVDFHLVASRKEYVLAAAFHCVLLLVGQGVCSVSVVDDLRIGLEGDSSGFEITFSDVCYASVDIEIPVPRSVHTPFDTELLTFCADVERYVHGSRLECFHEVGTGLCCYFANAQCHDGKCGDDDFSHCWFSDNYMVSFGKVTKKVLYDKENNV